MEKPDVVSVQAHAVKPIFEEVGRAEELQPFHRAVQAESAKVVDSVSPLFNPGLIISSVVPQETKSKSGLWFLGGGGGDGDSKSSSSGASSSASKSGSKSIAGDFPWHLSVQAAFQIAKIPAPPLERLLPVGFNPPPLSPTVKSLSRGSSLTNPYESPESPMSKMDMISIGKEFKRKPFQLVFPATSNLLLFLMLVILKLLRYM